MQNDSNYGGRLSDFPMEIPPYQITEHTNSKTYTIYLNEEIVEAEKYSKLFNLLRSAGEYDVIQIHINSPGGNLFTGIQLITCMKQCMAHIITTLDGMAFSLAPLILFAGDEINISENSMIMFHNYSSAQYGKGNEQLSNVNAMNDFYRNTLSKYAKPFLSDDEIDEIINGKDLYFGDDVITERIDRIMEEYESEENEAEDPEAESGEQLEFDFVDKD